MPKMDWRYPRGRFDAFPDSVNEIDRLSRETHENHVIVFALAICIPVGSPRPSRATSWKGVIAGSCGVRSSTI